MDATIAIETANDIETTKERVVRYFRNAGYNTSDEDGLLIFARGSLLGSWTSFSPKGWQTSVRVQMKRNETGGTKVDVRYDINTTGQMVTQSEVDFWNAEKAGIVRLLTQNEFFPADSGASEKTVVRANWQLFGKWLLYILLAVGMFVPYLYLMLFPVRFLSRWWVNLVPVIGIKSVALLSTGLFLGMFAILALSPVTRWTAKLRDRSPQNNSWVLAFAAWGLVVGLLSGTFIGLAMAFLDIVRIVPSNMAVGYVLAALVGMLGIAFVKSKQGRKTPTDRA